MTRGPVTVELDVTVAHCTRLMEQHRIKRLPVGHDGRLAGIVSRANVLRAVLQAPARIGTDAASRDAQVLATLYGSVRSEAARRGLHVLATCVDGIMRVEDQLTVGPRDHADVLT